MRTQSFAFKTGRKCGVKEKMLDVTVIIPNYNGKQYIRECLGSLCRQSCGQVPVIVVDNASADGSLEIIRQEFPEVTCIKLPENQGFCRAVNIGIRAADTTYVILLNNDTAVKEDFVPELLQAIQKDGRIFSCQAQMRQMDCPELLDSAGDFYSAFGWALSRGKNAPCEAYRQESSIFSACAGAAIYRKELFEKIGYFDEEHFAYLEDVDIGYRAKIAGYENRYAPKAVVFHKGSAATGSRYNRFKVKSAARNNLYLLYKNMPRWQLLINLPFLAAGMLIKLAFFAAKGMGLTYLAGLKDGILLARGKEKTPFLAENFDNCWRIQLELWCNLIPCLRGSK